MSALKENRFPLLKFDVIAKEDREKTIERGMLQHKEVNVVYIKQIGEKDESVRDADEWIAQLKEQASRNDERAPREWYEFALKMYERHKAGHEVLHEGFQVREWAILSPSQVKNLHGMDTFTVEQIAGWNDNAIGMYGIGGRELRDKAKEWLKSGDEKAEQIIALRVENKKLSENLENLMSQLNDLKARFDEDEKKPRGRPRAE